MSNDIVKDDIANEVLNASRQWISAFNRSDAQACASGYLPDAMMHARPMGEYRGREAIETFWRDFMQSTNAGELAYSQIEIEAIDETTATLAASWSMNVGRGIITEERWVKRDGQWYLAYDDFTVQEQFA